MILLHFWSPPLNRLFFTLGSVRPITPSFFGDCPIKPSLPNTCHTLLKTLQILRACPHVCISCTITYLSPVSEDEVIWLVLRSVNPVVFRHIPASSYDAAGTSIFLCMWDDLIYSIFSRMYFVLIDVSPSPHGRNRVWLCRFNLLWSWSWFFWVFCHRRLHRDAHAIAPRWCYCPAQALRVFVYCPCHTIPSLHVRPRVFDVRYWQLLSHLW